MHHQVCSLSKLFLLPDSFLRHQELHAHQVFAVMDLLRETQNLFWLKTASMKCFRWVCLVSRSLLLRYLPLTDLFSGEHFLLKTWKHFWTLEDLLQKVRNYWTNVSNEGICFFCRLLLVMVALLGAVSGVAFSAAYQLVARFANKNIISLGLGCVGSGLVVLILESALQIKASPLHWQQMVLFELTAGWVSQIPPQVLHTTPTSSHHTPSLPSAEVWWWWPVEYLQFLSWEWISRLGSISFICHLKPQHQIEN